MGTATPSYGDHPTAPRLGRTAVTTLVAVGAAAVAVRVPSRRRVAGVSERPSRRGGRPAQAPAGAAEVARRLGDLHAPAPEAHDRVTLTVRRLGAGDLTTTRECAARAALDAETVVYRAGDRAEPHG